MNRVLGDPLLRCDLRGTPLLNKDRGEPGLIAWAQLGDECLVQQFKPLAVLEVLGEAGPRTHTVIDQCRQLLRRDWLRRPWVALESPEAVMDVAPGDEPDKAEKRAPTLGIPLTEDLSIVS